MVIKVFRFSIIILSLLVLFQGQSFGKKWTVTVKDYSFVPYNLTHVRAHDTIEWVWESGIHTTTSTSLPADAMDWDFPIDQDNPKFIYIPTVNGTYFYQSTPDTAKSMNGHFVVSGANGVPEGISTGFKVFPNPASEKVFISLPAGLPEPVNLSVYDSRGKLVHQSSTNPQKNMELFRFDMGMLPGGVYFFKMSTSGKEVYLQKVIRK